MLAIGDKLKKLRKEFGLTQEELAEKIGMTKPTISSYESDKRSISLDAILKIANLFNVELNYFFPDFFPKNESNGSLCRNIPIVSRVSVGNGEWGTDEILDHITLPESICKNCDFGTFVKGDSMEPKIYDNDLILIRKTPNLNSGEIGIFKIDNEVYCKKFKYNPFTHEIILKSLNEKYNPIYIDLNKENFTILGKVLCKIDYNF